jgi:hypothetical protein
MSMLSEHFYTLRFCSELVGTQLDSKGVLMMVYNTMIYWVFGLCPSCGILKNTKEGNVLEIGFHGLGLLNKFSTSFTILVTGLCMLYHNFYCTFFLLPPIDKAWSQV